jgi:hypothetical protein
MAVAALVISLVAVLVAILSVGFTARADRRAGRAERRDEERTERERQEAGAANRARLAIWPNGSSATTDERRFGYVIRNHGKVTARDVHVYLYDENGQDVSTKPQAGFSLAPDEEADIYGVTVPLGVEPENVRFGVRWFDGAGFHRLHTSMPPTF